MKEDSLNSRRQIAAQASLGISNNDIYRIFEKLIVQKELSGDLLDFGAGTGNLTKLLNHLNCFDSMTATDILPRPKDLNFANWISADLNKSINIQDASFDVIVSAEVIEHLENPRFIAREWFRLLRPGGTLIFSTPNNESWRALLALFIQGHFAHFGDSSYPAHITALVRKDILRILSEAGFCKCQFQFTDEGGIPKLPTTKWQSVLPFLKGVRFSDNLLAIAQRPMT